MIMIGRMAEKYSKLPHEVEQNATTYDIMIMDVLSTYDNYQQQKSSGKLIDASVYGLNQEDLKNIMNKSDNVKY
jgi:hypothetical protein